MFHAIEDGNNNRTYLKIKQRKKPLQSVPQDDDQEEQYFQNLEEQKQNDESVCFEFKRMTLSDELEETMEIVGSRKKNKQQLGDFYYICELNALKIQQSIISYRSTGKSERAEVQPQIEDNIYVQETSQDSFHLVQIDEINYINSLNFENYQIRRKAQKYKSKKSKKTSLSNLQILAKGISK
ncbi:unnamed protein product [Paramecium octaurelia]|uniref:Uncharacterized protein n=1 Tax=Paramecium octaurelia TaxID=43137 RepID=A0A8S1VE75_PAROT|nr:unnamed protein product [Paramecium octaurelia]